MSQTSLKDKTVRGVGWSAIDSVARYAVTFIVGIILARLLSPEDYGLLGIVVIFTNVCNAIIEGGFSSALIRKKDANEDDYETTFIVNMGLSLLLYAVIFICAPLIASFFGRVELVALTRVSSVGMIIGAMAMVQSTRLTKQIDFKTQTKISMITSILSGVVGIIMAFCGYGVWSLVAQSLVSQAANTLLLWMYNRWVPRLNFSGESFRDLFGFGWKIMLSSLLNSVWREMYQVIVGKFYQPATLGQYTRAKGYSTLFSSNLTRVVQRVTFPVLSEIQNDTERMKNAYRRIITTTMFITASLLFFLGAVSEPLLYCMIGPKWHDASVYLPLICISVSLYPIHSINLNMLQVQGRSDLYLVLEIVKKIIMIGPFVIGAFVGILPMLYTNIIASLLGYLIDSHYSGKRIGYSTLMQLRDVAPSYAVATIVALSVYFFKYLPISNWIILPTQLVVGIVAFLIVNKIVRLDEYEQAKGVVAPFFKKINGRLNK